jgi:hypothetical protein
VSSNGGSHKESHAEESEESASLVKMARAEESEGVPGAIIHEAACVSSRIPQSGK